MKNQRPAESKQTPNQEKATFKMVGISWYLLALLLPTTCYDTAQFGGSSGLICSYFLQNRERKVKWNLSAGYLRDWSLSRLTLSSVPQKWPRSQAKGSHGKHQVQLVETTAGWTGEQRREKGRGRELIWRNNGQKLPPFKDIHGHTNKSSTNSK